VPPLGFLKIWEVKIYENLTGILDDVSLGRWIQNAFTAYVIL
jgi:hypothetical protein